MKNKTGITQQGRSKNAFFRNEIEYILNLDRTAEMKTLRKLTGNTPSEVIRKI